MKRSSKVTLTVVAMMGLAACSRRRDPCESQYFNELACQEAVRGGGYYYHDVWYRTSYGYPYSYYYNSYHTHVLMGHSSHSVPYSSYTHSSSSSSSSGSVSRGGFGSTGSHASSSS